MNGYGIDQQVLADSARALDQAAESLRTGLLALGGAGRIDLGTDELDTAATTLLRRSTDALERARADIATTGAGVRDSMARYLDAEDRITDLLRPGGTE